jgi:glycosyltransferase involved in cell wall biosynthesis
MPESVATIAQRPAAPFPEQKARLRVAYVMSRFPKLTETFILYEMQALERCGVEVEVFPLLPAGSGAKTSIEGVSLTTKLRELLWPSGLHSVMHAEAAPYVARAHYGPLLSWEIAKANLHCLRRTPRAYLAALATLVQANWGSRRLLLGGLALFPKMAWLARRMEGRGVQHVHAHFATHPAAAAFVIRRLTGIPYSFTAHGSDLHVDRHMLREKAAEAASVITISEYNKELIVAECGEPIRSKVQVLHCGVDASVFRPPARRFSADEAAAFCIVCIGTLYEVKGQTYLIEACRRLREHGVNFVCHLVGDGPDRQRLTRQAEEAGVADAVRFHGRQTREEIAALLNEADVLVAPSVMTRDGRREGIPVVLMEALGSGVPAVASRLSGIPELVIHEETGLLVPERNAEALAQALERLARDPALRRRLGQAGAAKVRREFDLERNAAALARHFEELAQRCG